MASLEVIPQQDAIKMDPRARQIAAMAVESVWGPDHALLQPDHPYIPSDEPSLMACEKISGYVAFDGRSKEVIIDSLREVAHPRDESMVDPQLQSEALALLEAADEPPSERFIIERQHFYAGERPPMPKLPPEEVVCTPPLPAVVEVGKHRPVHIALRGFSELVTARTVIVEHFPSGEHHPLVSQDPAADEQVVLREAQPNLTQAIAQEALKAPGSEATTWVYNGMNALSIIGALKLAQRKGESWHDAQAEIILRRLFHSTPDLLEEAI